MTRSIDPTVVHHNTETSSIVPSSSSASSVVVPSGDDVPLSVDDVSPSSGDDATTTSVITTGTFITTTTSVASPQQLRDIENNLHIGEALTPAEQLIQQQALVAAEIHEQKYPSRHVLHKMIIVFSIITCIAAIFMLIGQIIGIFIFRSYGAIQYVFHFYVLLLCVIVVLVECEFTPIGKQSFIFSYWITRGLSYTFIGVLGLEGNDTADWSKPNDATENFVKVVAWFMIIVGTIYFFLGQCCVQVMHTKARKDYDDRCIRAKELRKSKNKITSKSNAVHSTTPSATTTTEVVPPPSATTTTTTEVVPTPSEVNDTK